MNWTLKKRTISTVQSFQYRKMTFTMIDSIAEQSQSMLNDFLSKTDISTTLSARNIIEGIPNLDYNTMFLKLGAHVQPY